MALTHRELCQIAYKFLKRNGFKVCFHDRFIAVTEATSNQYRRTARCYGVQKFSIMPDRGEVFSC
ncbi:hypothetical protein OkiPb00465_39920 [Escherichia coli]